VIVLIDIGRTHNLIHVTVVKETHYYVPMVHKFQIMIANRGMMKCGRKCEKVKLQIKEYNLNSNMFVIEMGGYNVALGEKWLQTLDLVTMEF